MKMKKHFLNKIKIKEAKPFVTQYFLSRKPVSVTGMRHLCFWWSALTLAAASEVVIHYRFSVAHLCGASSGPGAAR